MSSIRGLHSSGLPPTPFIRLHACNAILPGVPPVVARPHLRATGTSLRLPSSLLVQPSRCLPPKTQLTPATVTHATIALGVLFSGVPLSPHTPTPPSAPTRCRFMPCPGSERSSPPCLRTRTGLTSSPLKCNRMQSSLILPNKDCNRTMIQPPAVVQPSSNRSYSSYSPRLHTFAPDPAQTTSVLPHRGTASFPSRPQPPARLVILRLSR